MVIHVMKDGTTKTDITGHVVQMSDCETVYQVMKEIGIKEEATA